MANEGGQSIGHLVSKLGLPNATATLIRSKSLEYLRKYNSKMGRQTGVLGTLHVAKPAVAVDMACTSGDVSVNAAVDVKVLQRMSGVTLAQYQKVRSVMMKVVGVKQHVSPRDVCIQFGCLKLEKIVRDTLEEYDARRLARGDAPGADDMAMGTSRRVDASGLDGDRPGRNGRWSPRLVGAAFTLVADAYKARFDKKRLIATLGVQQREYKVALEDMSKELHDVFFDEGSENEAENEEEDKVADNGGARDKAC